MIDSRSLTFRLAATSALWVTATMLAVGILLIYLFRDHIERRFDTQLEDHMEELVAASEITPENKLRLTWTPSDPRFHRPYSGWYWQIVQDGKILHHSRSLWRDKLPPGANIGDHNRQILVLKGPGEKRLRGLVRTISLPGASSHFLFTITGPIENIERDVGLFARQLAITLGLLALALMAVVLLQVRFGLRPLRTMQQNISDIRKGRKKTISTKVPTEITPVVQELNALLDHNKTMLEKARAQAANLAHALKNPLTVISIEAARVEGGRGKILRDQTRIVSHHLERHLSRMQAAGKQHLSEQKTPLAPIIEDLCFSMQLLYKNRQLSASHTGFDDLVFAGDPRDMQEMLGNLFDNACKWAKSRIRINGDISGENLVISIEDDGAGIAKKHIRDITRRGLRLDETVAGCGLGLDIVRDIAELYEGRLHLARSGLGGLKAELHLPAAR